MLSEALREKPEPARRPELAAWFQGTFQVSCLRACRLAQFWLAPWYRRSRATDQSALRIWIRDKLEKTLGGILLGRATGEA